MKFLDFNIKSCLASLIIYRRFAFITSILVVLLCYNIRSSRIENRRSIQDTGFDPIEAEASLRNHSKKFEQRIEKVTDGVYVAIGYALSNMIFLEGFCIKHWI